MKVAVRDCLGLDVLSGAKVLTGDIGLNNTVSAAVILETLDPTEILEYFSQGEQLIFSNLFSLCADEGKQISIIEALAKGGNAGLIVSSSNKNTELLSKKTIKAAEAYGFPLVVLWEDSPYSCTDIIVGLKAALSHWENSPDRDVKIELLNALRRGNKREALRLREDLAINGDSILSVFFAKGMLKKEALELLREFEADEDMEIIALTEEGETYGLVLKAGVSGKEELLMEKNKCVALFNRIKEEKSIRIFHVTGVAGLDGAIDGYRLIAETSSLVQTIFPYKRVFTKYELVLSGNCINIQIQGSQVKKNYMELLEPFWGSGETKGRQLLETLETFVLDAGMNSGKTSEFMGIHTNTVQYRLKRSNDILGVEIMANRVIPGLTIALALRRLEGSGQ